MEAFEILGFIKKEEMSGKLPDNYTDAVQDILDAAGFELHEAYGEHAGYYILQWREDLTEQDLSAMAGTDDSADESTAAEELARTIRSDVGDTL